MDGYAQPAHQVEPATMDIPDHRRHLLAFGAEAKTREAGCDAYVASPSPSLFSLPAQLLAKVRGFIG